MGIERQIEIVSSEFDLASPESLGDMNIERLVQAS